LWKIHELAKNYDHMRALVIRKQRSDLSETGLVTFERDILGTGSSLVIDGPRRQYRHAYILPNGSNIVIGGLDKPGKILSSEYDIIYVQQAEELAPADWETLITRLSGLALPADQQQLIGDCNPASPQHWIMQRSLEGNLKLWETYHTDNPLLHDGENWTTFGREYLDRLMASLTGTKAAIA
jgi:phage terminase large subunit